MSRTVLVLSLFLLLAGCGDRTGSATALGGLPDLTARDELFAPPWPYDAPGQPFFTVTVTPDGSSLRVAVDRPGAFIHNRFYVSEGSSWRPFTFPGGGVWLADGASAEVPLSSPGTSSEEERYAIVYACVRRSSTPGGWDCGCVSSNDASCRRYALQKFTVDSTTPPVVSLHRIGVRTSVGGTQEFYDTVTGRKFVPRGNNYIRVDGSGHSLFSPQSYDATEVEADLAQMEYDRYNIIRVFWDYAKVAVDGSNPPLLDDAYMANVLDLLARARDHHIYVTFTGNHIPLSYGAYYVPQHTLPANVGNTNLYYMSEGHIEAYAMLWRDFIRHIKEHDEELLSVVFSYDIANEPTFSLAHAPFNESTGSVTPACCRTYDLSSTLDRQAVADDSFVYWVNRTVATIKAEDPFALTTTGTYTPQAVGRDGSFGLWPLVNPTPLSWFVPPRIVALEQSALDYLDLHRYPDQAYSMAADVATGEYSSWRREKPFIYGEFGAAKHFFPDVTDAAYAMRDFQVDSCDYGFQGWMLWTWDTASFTDFWNAADHGGSLNGVLAPIARPDPCIPS